MIGCTLKKVEFVLVGADRCFRRVREPVGIVAFAIIHGSVNVFTHKLRLCHPGGHHKSVFRGLSGKGLPDNGVSVVAIFRQAAAYHESFHGRGLCAHHCNK